MALKSSVGVHSRVPHKHSIQPAGKLVLARLLRFSSVLSTQNFGSVWTLMVFFATKQAFVDFQSSSGLTEDGVVAPATWAALFGDQPTFPSSASGQDVLILQHEHLGPRNTSRYQPYVWRQHG